MSNTSMTKETLTALRLSIHHWKRNVKAVTVGQSRTTRLDCALCVLYFDEVNCGLCPIANDGHEFYSCGCSGTPYTDASMARDDWSDCSSTSNRTAFRKAARKEVKYLKGLLPE